MLKNVVFFGTEHFSAPTLRVLIEANYHIAYVITKPDTQRGRGRVLESPEVKKIANAHHIPVLQPQKMSEIIEPISALENPVGVLVAFGKIIPKSIIDLFTPGIINIHPSLLPKYRGPSPIESVILHGETTTGISIMRLVADMDAGPIYSQVTIPLSDAVQKSELYEQFSKKGAAMISELLPCIVDGILHAVAQDDSQATYCSLLTKRDGIMDIEHKSASDLEREVRAYTDFPKSRVLVNGRTIIVTKSHVVTSSGPLVLNCKDDTFLQIDEVIAPSGKKMNASAFIHGYGV